MSACREAQDRASVIPGCDPVPVLEAGEHVLDLVAAAIERGIVWNLDLAAKPRWDTRRNPQVDQSVAEPIRIMAPVCQQSPGLRDRGQQRPRADVGRGLAGREEHVDRSPLCVGQDMQFRVQTAFRPTDQPSAPPFLTARLEAVRCVVRCPRQWFSDQWRTTCSTSIITIPVSCVMSDNHHCRCRQFRHDRGEHPHPAPLLPAVVEGLGRPIGRRRVRDGP